MSPWRHRCGPICELNVARNGIAALSPAPACAALTELDASGNAVADWATGVQPLSVLLSLARLLLPGNPLRDVQYTGGFAALSVLVVADTQLDSWSAVDALGAAPRAALWCADVVSCFVAFVRSIPALCE